MMKKTCKLMTCVLAFVLCALCLKPYEVQAGLSHVTVDDSSFEKELNTAVWNVPEADVAIDDGKLVFSEESTKYTRLITKNTAQKTEERDELVTASFALQIKSMPENGEFILGFGLDNIESFSEEAGQVEIVFLNNGGLQLAVRCYEEAGGQKEAVAPKTAGFSIGSKVAVKAVVYNNRSLVVLINGQKVASAELPFLPEGSVGFFQTGKCAATLSELEIQTYRYDRPENSDFEENFDKDRYNANLLFSKASASAYAPSTMSIEEYNGNYVMWYENSGAAQIGTMFQYSNFELTFDVPYLLRKDITDENGNVLNASSMWFGVSFGDELIECADNGFTFSPDMIYFDRDSAVRSFARGYEVVAQSEKYPFFAEEEERGISVKISVIDAHVTIGMKWIDEKDFTTIGEYDVADGTTPLGYVHIWTCGPGNFAVDNIKMKNLDKEPNLVEVEFATSKFEVPEDYVYTKGEMVFREAGKEDDDFNWYLIIPCTAAVGILIVGISAIVAAKRRRNKYDET